MGLLQTMGLVLLWQIIGQGLVLAVSTAGFDRDTRDTVTSELPATTWAPLRFWQKTEYPNPKYDTDKCGREGQKSYVCDPNRIMTLEEGKCGSNAFNITYTKSKTYLTHDYFSLFWCLLVDG